MWYWSKLSTSSFKTIQSILKEPLTIKFHHPNNPAIPRQSSEPERIGASQRGRLAGSHTLTRVPEKSGTCPNCGADEVWALAHTLPLTDKLQDLLQLPGGRKPIKLTARNASLVITEDLIRKVPSTASLRLHLCGAAPYNVPTKRCSSPGQYCRYAEKRFHE